jgi:hypothetical protein
MDFPTQGELPEYMLPEFDRSRVSELTELEMGAPLGRLRQGLNRALIEARYSDNPNVRALARKKALSGYGEGLSDIRTGAHRRALSQYAPEYQAKIGKAGAEYQAGVGRVQQKYQADLNRYLQSMIRTQPRGNIPITEPGQTYQPRRRTSLGSSKFRTPILGIDQLRA